MGPHTLSPAVALSPLPSFHSAARIFSPSVAPPPAPPRAAAPAAELACAAPRAQAPAPLLRASAWPHAWRAGPHPPAARSMAIAPLPDGSSGCRSNGRSPPAELPLPTVDRVAAPPTPACAPRIELSWLWLRSSRTLAAAHRTRRRRPWNREEVHRRRGIRLLRLLPPLLSFLPR
jgi:hypothetical protein